MYFSTGRVRCPRPPPGAPTPPIRLAWDNSVATEHIFKVFGASRYIDISGRFAAVWQNREVRRLFVTADVADSFAVRLAARYAVHFQEGLARATVPPGRFNTIFRQSGTLSSTRSGKRSIFRRDSPAQQYRFPVLNHGHRHTSRLLR